MAPEDGANGEGGEFEAMLLPEMVGQPEAAQVGGFALLHHQLLYLCRRLAREALGPSGEVFQRKGHLLLANELLH